MNDSGILKPVLYVVVCLILMCVALTLLGPAIGSLYYSYSMAPGLTGLTCPIGLRPGESGDVVALVAHSSSEPRTYRVTFAEFDEEHFTSTSLAYCTTIIQIGAGHIATVTCSIEKSSNANQNVLVKAVAQGDDYSITCHTGCDNVFESICTLRGDLIVEMLSPANLGVTATVLGVGLVLAVLGAALWFDTGRIGKVVIALFSALSIELLAYFFGFIYSHWLPAAILNGMVAAAVAAYILWRRRKLLSPNP